MIESVFNFAIGDGINSYNCWVDIERLLLFSVKHPDVRKSVSVLLSPLLQSHCW